MCADRPVRRRRRSAHFDGAVLLLVLLVLLVLRLLRLLWRRLQLLLVLVTHVAYHVSQPDTH